MARYVGRGSNGTEKLREEIKAQNEGVVSKLAEIKARAMRGEMSASSVTFAVKEEEMANRIIKNRVRIMGRIYQVKVYQEAGPHAMWNLLWLGEH